MRHFRPFFEPQKMPEAVDDVISGMALDYAGTDVPTSFDDYRLNDCRTIRLCPAGAVVRTSVQYLITFCILS